MSGLTVAIVYACLRDGAGGSPTAVLDEAPLPDHERRLVPARMGTSHAVFVDDRHPHGPVALRFFTAEGELPACGHGTVAALAVLGNRAADPRPEYVLRAGGRDFTGRVTRDGALFDAMFDPGPVHLRDPVGDERDLTLAALGISPAELAPGISVAAVGRARLLVPVATRSAVAALSPDQKRLRAACDRLDLLGCFVYSAPVSGERVAARMFAPSIGVPEDIANANSTACLAAHLAGRGITDIAVEMGDSLAAPATIIASGTRGPAGLRVWVGGTARLGDVARLA